MVETVIHSIFPIPWVLVNTFGKHCFRDGGNKVRAETRKSRHNMKATTIQGSELQEQQGSLKRGCTVRPSAPLSGHEIAPLHVMNLTWPSLTVKTQDTA